VDAEHERRLIQQAQHDPAAFRELYRHYFPRVYGYVAYRVGRREDAEDIVSDIFLKVIEKLDTFENRGAGAFAAWVFRIAHNAVSSHHRQRDMLPLQEDWHSSFASPDQQVIQQEQQARLRDQIAALPPRRQEVIMLKYFGGLRNQEIAAVLELDERTVASHLSRALEDLQQKLGEALHE